MDHRLKNSFIFVAIAWPVMMLAAYLLSVFGAFQSANLLIFGILGLPALFAARFVSLQFTDRSRP